MERFLQEPNLRSMKWLALEQRRVFSIVLTLRFRSLSDKHNTMFLPPSETKLQAQWGCWRHLLYRFTHSIISNTSWHYSNFKTRYRIIFLLQFDYLSLKVYGFPNSQSIGHPMWRDSAMIYFYKNHVIDYFLGINSTWLPNSYGSRVFFKTQVFNFL